MIANKRDGAPADRLVQMIESDLGENRDPTCHLANRRLILVVELVEAIRIIDQLQHLRLDAFSGAAASVTDLLQKRDLLGKRLQNDRPLQGVEVGHIAPSKLGLLGVEEALVQPPSCYQGGAPFRLVAPAIELGLDQGGQLMAKVDQTRDGNVGDRAPEPPNSSTMSSTRLPPTSPSPGAPSTRFTRLRRRPIWPVLAILSSELPVP